MAKAEFLKSEDYQLAFDIYTGKAIRSIDIHDETDEWSLPNYALDPEKLLIKKESLLSLSEEAKQVIEMLINSPVETIKALSSPTGLLTKRSVKLGLQKLWHSKFIAKKVTEELTAWTNRL